MSASTGWLPTSPCGPECLPVPDPDAGLARVRRLVRTALRLTGLVATLRPRRRARSCWRRPSGRAASGDCRPRGPDSSCPRPECAWW